ncbi:MAG: hypothetical protein G3M70_15370 [Candidatus Nitronauta litoralis]|uniref:Protein BatD n=1 Tax=Candidatus Nitronauta litoralis TaxID=2705533 RepID=A0A7T0BYC7_9BACT|nr:MAG: hypothetical protein G3M70_15370 [Candidatus Nitronauta litoralis]
MVLTAFSAWAEDKPASSGVKIDAEISPAEITVGDLAIYTVTITHDKSVQTSPPVPNGDFTGFELVDQGTSQKNLKAGKTEHQFWYKLRGDHVGVHIFPGPKVKYKGLQPDIVGEFDSGEVSGPDVQATIRSVLYLDGEPRDIKSIKPIVGAAWPWKKYLLPALAFVLLASLIGFAANWWVKRNLVKPQIPRAPALPPHELALKELERLYAKGYHLKNQNRELYFEFSEIFRRYLGFRFNIPALDWTTEEIGRVLNHHNDLSKAELDGILRILTSTDLVKFAKFEVDSDTAVRLMKSARSLIQKITKTSKPETSTELETVTNTS